MTYAIRAPENHDKNDKTTEERSDGTPQKQVGHGLRAPCKGVDLQWEAVPPGNWSLPPVAIGAAMEVTISSKPLMEKGRLAAQQVGRP